MAAEACGLAEERGLAGTWGLGDAKGVIHISPGMNQSFGLRTAAPSPLCGPLGAWGQK